MKKAGGERKISQRRLKLKVRLKRLDPDLPLPKYAHKNDAGCDLYSRVDLVIKPDQWALVSTGIALAIPAGYAGFIQPRSGLALKNGISIVNSPGLIDSGYRGEVGVILINHHQHKSFEIKKGDKICQLVIQKIETPIIEVVEELDNAERAKRGFGSSGTI